MKFLFGKTYSAKRKEEAEKRRKLAGWRPHFAWLPVMVGQRGDHYEYRWLETVERCVESFEDYYGHTYYHPPTYRVRKT